MTLRARDQFSRIDSWTVQIWSHQTRWYNATVHYIVSKQWIELKLTFPRSNRYWHFVRQSGEFVKVDSALSAAFLVAVSVASYNCLQRRSSWAISCQEKQSFRVLCILKIIGGGVVFSSLYNFIPRLPVPPFLFWTQDVARRTLHAHA